MLRACDLEDWGEVDTIEEQLAFEWELSDLDLSRDVWLVHAAGGELAGYTWVLGREGHQRLDGWGAVHPDHRGRGLGDHLMRLRQQVDGVHAALAGPDAPVRSYFGTVGPDRAAHELAERYGWREVRHFWQMAMELPTAAGAMPAPRWPEGISARVFEPGRDDRVVHATLQEAFSEHWGHVYMPFDDWAKRMELEWFDPSLWWVAESGGEVAGALVGAELEGDGWVMTLGVREPWRGRGIGEALLWTSFDAFRSRGLSTVKLDVDAGNETGATRLYERVGMRAIRQYDDFERILRDGPVGPAR
jgi:mycothiol synthase